MKKILFSLIAFIVCTTAMAQQRFMDDLRKEKVGQGKVIVYQSLVIDALVNGSANTKNGDSKPDNKISAERR